MRGDGRIFKQRGQHVWTIAYYAPGPNNKRTEHRESAKTADEKAARDLLKRRIRAIANDRDGIREFNGPQAQRVTVAELLATLLAKLEGKRRPDSFQRVKYQMRIVREQFGHYRAAELGSKTIRAYITDRQKAGYTDKTIKHRVALLLSAYRLGVTDKVLAEYMVPGVELPTGDNVRQGFFERDELEALLPHLPLPLDDAALFSYLTGWRRGTILGLTWSEVDRKNGIIHIPGARTKNRKPVTIPLVEALKPLLAIIERRATARSFTSNLVFHRNGKPISRNTFMKQWHTACVKAGLGRWIPDETKKGKRRYEGKIFHDFRRTAVRNLIRAGVAQSVAMTVTMHKTTSVFTRYDITDTRDVLDALQRVCGDLPGAVENTV